MTKVSLVVVSTVVLLLLSSKATNLRTTGLVQAFSVVPPSRKSVQRVSRKGVLSLPIRSMPAGLATPKENQHRLLATPAGGTADEPDDSGNNDKQQHPKIRNVVIAGGGIIGTSVAYYLAQQDPFRAAEASMITIVDPTGTVGSCASGKAGGFLARDWRDGTALQELQRTGFDLHQELANAFANNSGNTDDAAHPTDYRRLTCAAVAVDESEDDTTKNPTKRVPNKPPSKKLIDLEWVDPDVVLWGDTNNNEEEEEEDFTGGGAVYPMGDETTIAQVHPRKLCVAMLEAITGEADSGGVDLVPGRIVKATTKEDNGSRSMTGIELEDGRSLPCDVLVIACGPWTYEANQWFATGGDELDQPDSLLPTISAVKCHSILVPSATGRPNTQAVFFDSNGAIGDDGDLEVYPRPDGDSYVNGFANDEAVCVERPGEEAIEADKIELLRSAMDFVEKYDDTKSGNTISDEPFERPAPRDHTQQVCYWPETPDGLPIIGKIPAIDGAYVAAGHSVWGILQGPATGKALAELIVHGKSETVDLTPFGLERYENRIE